MSFEDKIDNILQKHPNLTPAGFKEFTPYAIEAGCREESRGRMRQYLVENEVAFERASSWIRWNLRPIRDCNRDYLNSMLDDFMSREIGAISVGCRQAALLGERYRFEKRGGGQDPQFNISSGSLHKSCRRIALGR